MRHRGSKLCQRDRPLISWQTTELVANTEEDVIRLDLSMPEPARFFLREDDGSACRASESLEHRAPSSRHRRYEIPLRKRRSVVRHGHVATKSACSRRY